MRAVAALLLLLAAPLAALEPYAVNPADTDAVAYGKVYIQGASDRACLNITPLDDDPATSADRSFYVVYAVSRKQLCFQMPGSGGGTPYCTDLTEP